MEFLTTSLVIFGAVIRRAISRRPSEAAQELEQRRVRAPRVLAEGPPKVKVVQNFRVDRDRFRRWKAALRKGGAKASGGKTPCAPYMLLVAHVLLVSDACS